MAGGVLMIEPLYKKTIVCDQCKSQFTTSKIRSSTVRVDYTDSDFCAHYRENNPNFYEVRVCPNCGSASTEKFMVPFNQVSRSIFMDKIGNHWRTKDFGGERTKEEAMQAYKLALLGAQIRGERDVIIAQLCHHIAWLYRYDEKQDDEKRFLGLALKSYMQSYVNEKADIHLSKLIYVIGELHARTGDVAEAIRWFGKIINEKSNVDPAMSQKARERWSDLRTPPA